MFKVLLLVVALAAVALAMRPLSPLGENDVVLAQWLKFKAQYGRKYATAEEERMRLQTFASNLATIRELNAGAPRGETPYGINEFADQTPEEFRAAKLMPRGSLLSMYPAELGGSCGQPDCNQTVLPPFQPQTLPTEFDWQGKATSPVYNQGQCGSCWTFSATEQIESMAYLQQKLSAVPSLSMQEIVSCDKLDGVMGCEGGWTQAAYDFVIQKGGLENFADYPYTAMTGTCKFQPSKINPVSTLSSWAYVASQGGRNETQMQYYIALNGPISICVDASSWQYYVGGIIRFFCSSNPANIDHCVQLTGYGVGGILGDTPFWTIRNSWGTSWGNAGYLYVERGYDECSIGDCATTVFTKNGSQL